MAETPGRVETVLKIMGVQLIGGGNGNRAQLMQRQHTEPELVMPLEHHHDLIPPFYPQRLKIIGRLVRGRFISAKVKRRS